MTKPLNLRFLFFVLMTIWIAGSANAYYTEIVDGLTWCYTITDDGAMVGQTGRLEYSNEYQYNAITTYPSGEVSIPSTLGGLKVVAIASRAFWNQRGITKIKIPATIRDIGAYAFECDNFSFVELESVDAWLNVRFYGNGYYYSNPFTVKNSSETYPTPCSNGIPISNIVIPSSVTSIGNGTFCNWGTLNKLILHNGVTAIGDRAFDGCSFRSVEITDLNAFKAISYTGATANPLQHNAELLLNGETVDKKSLISSSFFPQGFFLGDDRMTEITIPDGIAEIPTRAFDGCAALRSVIIPPSVLNINDRGFANCSSMIAISICDGMTNIGAGAFMNCSALKTIRIPEGIKQIKLQTFSNCRNLAEISIPSTLTSVSGYAVSTGASSSNPFYNCSYDKRVSFAGNVPTGYGVIQLTNNNYSSAYSYPKKIGANYYRSLRQKTAFNGFSDGSPSHVWSRATIRKNSPDIIDITFKVASTQNVVRVRAIAFEDGVRSMDKLIRVRTLIDDTSMFVGDSVTANEEHTISWKVSSDWAVDLAKVDVEILACDNEVLPFELIEIPASDGYSKMQVSWNTLTKSQIFNALLWYYADGDARLTLTDGVMSVDGSPVAMGTDFYTYKQVNDPYGGSYQENVYHTKDAFAYVVSKQGMTILTGDMLKHANEATRLNLTPDTDTYGYYGERQYAYKVIEETTNAND